MSRGYEVYTERLEEALKAKGYGKGKTGRAAELIGKSRAYFTTIFNEGRIGRSSIKVIDEKLGISPQIYVKAFVDQSQQSLMALLGSGDDEEIDLQMMAMERFPEEFKVWQRACYEGTYAAMVDFYKDRRINE